MNAKQLAEEAIETYRIPGPDQDEPNELPDGSVFVIKYEGKTYYFMCEDGAVKDQSKDYKDLIKSDDYKQDKDHVFSDDIKLYIKK